MLKILSVICFIVCVSCNKGDVASKCSTIPNGPAHGWEYLYDSAYSYFTDINPANGTEILFVKRPFNNGLCRLYIYDAVTRKSREIFQGRIIFSPRWGTNGWILLNLSDANIWKIKDNGDSLIQLTFTGNLYTPSWNYTHDKFIADRADNVRALYDETGGFITVLNGLYQYGTNIYFFNDSLFAYTADRELGIYNIKTLQKEVLARLEGDNFFRNPIVRQETVLCYANQGLYSVNMQTRQLVHLTSSCNAKVYGYLSYSKHLDKLFVTQTTSSVMNAQSLFQKSSILMVNPDGSNEVNISQ
ncbi:MAG TPA: hypothetical protein PL009_07955 [Flavipsychrobacter sp.]|nr:hypothetical protein [Flavipsychrobacter sp.]